MLVNRMVPFGGTPARVERIVTGAVGLESATSLRERQTFYLVPVSLCHNCVPEPYLFRSLRLALSEKQMPRFVEIIDS